MADTDQLLSPIKWLLSGIAIGALAGVVAYSIVITGRVKRVAQRIQQKQQKDEEERTGLTEIILRQMGFPDLPPAVIKEEAFDYGRITDKSYLVDRLRAGQHIKPKRFFDGDIKSIDDLVIPNSAIIRVNQPDSARYQAVLVGVGYPDEQTLHGDLSNAVKQLSRVYATFDINFSYLSIPMPITVDRIERQSKLPNKEEVELLLSKLGKIAIVDRLMLILNTDENIGAARNLGKDAAENVFYPIAPGHYKHALLQQAHELAHTFGLGDGYERYYRNGEFGTSELFRNPYELKRHVLRALSRVHPIVVGSTGNVCKGAPVYAFFLGEFNIMANKYTDEEILQRAAQDLPIFNPLQTQIINDTISHAIASRPK